MTADRALSSRTTPALVLRDAGSTNGTFLGSRRVSQLTITDNCELRLGHPDDGPAVSCSLTVPARPAPSPDGPPAGSPPAGPPAATPPAAPPAGSPPAGPPAATPPAAPPAGSPPAGPPAATPPAAPP